ncbi:hypothetical protein DPV99_09960 [Aggregatibacter aphrophilus]|jgi:hypothetical protein|uniref:hypothetical protein n=1 Tax=Aggregatibacter kilianii TaxID=2025884 RepID=UPI000DAD79DB|nr:hypothetical protein [Aggregatibacter kilianii]RDF00228.1 hypothetical protein DPV99_09960 [Aggregatibacter aphrophilus]
MLDIKQEIQSVKDDFNSQYVTLYDLIECLKEESSASYSEIAQYLLIKLLPYEPIPDRRFEIDTGLDALSHYQFLNSDYIVPYRTPSKLYHEVEAIDFEEIKDKLKLLEAFNEWLPF